LIGAPRSTPILPPASEKPLLPHPGRLNGKTGENDSKDAPNHIYAGHSKDIHQPGRKQECDQAKTQDEEQQDDGQRLQDDVAFGTAP
jgi:hypothetical protein